MKLDGDSHPLNDFPRGPKETGHPIDADRNETIKAVREGLASMKRGEGRSMDVFFEELEADLFALKGRRGPARGETPGKTESPDATIPVRGLKGRRSRAPSGHSRPQPQSSRMYLSFFIIWS